MAHSNAGKQTTVEDNALQFHQVLDAAMSAMYGEWSSFDEMTSLVCAHGCQDNPDIQSLRLNEQCRRDLISYHDALISMGSGYERRRYAFSILIAAAGEPSLFQSMTASLIEAASIESRLSGSFNDALRILPLMVLSPNNQRYQTRENEENQSFVLMMYLIARSVKKTEEYDFLINKCTKGLRDGYSIYLSGGLFSNVINKLDKRPGKQQAKWIIENVTNSLYDYLIDNAGCTFSFQPSSYVQKACEAIQHANNRDGDSQSVHFNKKDKLAELISASLSEEVLRINFSQVLIGLKRPSIIPIDQHDNQLSRLEEILAFIKINASTAAHISSCNTVMAAMIVLLSQPKKIIYSDAVKNRTYSFAMSNIESISLDILHQRLPDEAGKIIEEFVYKGNVKSSIKIRHSIKKDAISAGLEL
ncbi:hypothetical protein P5704_023900 (plasmid) [Pseudomonas sp. FeN3W]|nr:hypothetical protein P5704_023900 [Pseudomonas sp. FeN3W]